MLTNSMELKMQEFWENVDDILFLTSNQYEKMTQKIRRAIVNVLAEGISSKTSMVFKEDTRHIMSAIEIKIELEKRLETSVKIANLYYHLNALEELNLVSIPFIFQTNEGRGKKNQSYYSRTAKIYLNDDSINRNKPELEILKTKGFCQLVKDLNPKLTQNHLDSIISKIERINHVDSSLFVRWMNNYQNILSKIKINARDLYILLHYLQIFDPQVREGINNLSELLKIE